LSVKLYTDEDVYGISEATINGFIATTEAAVHELVHFVTGKDPRQINAVANAIISTIAATGHIHRLVMGAIEVACWDILGRTFPGRREFRNRFLPTSSKGSQMPEFVRAMNRTK